MSIIKSYIDSEATAQALASDLMEKINRKSPFYLAVSGGSTPKKLFESLASLKNSIQWNHLQLYWVDERCVPPTDNESNYKMSAEVLLSHINLPQTNIHRIKGEITPEDALEDYQQNIILLPRSNGFPEFDLIILGMGDDGHTASIFPPSMELLTIEQDLAIGINPYSGQQRVTLTGKTINNAKEIYFHVTGNNKAIIFDKIMHKVVNYQNYPASYFNNEKTTWWVDNAVLL